MAFTHLHLHSEYSLLDGAAQIKKVVKKAKELGMDSLAITDHGVMFGVVDFYKECLSNGIHPILGCEVYEADGSRLNHDVQAKKPYHLVLLAENEQGYKNLMKLVSRGFTEGFYYKPRIDQELLEKYHEGLIALSACMAGKVANLILARNYNAAKQAAIEYENIFGHGNFFLEMQNHGTSEDEFVNNWLRQISEETNIPLVVTNDVHYVTKDDAKYHDVLLAIQTATTIDDPNRMRYPGEEFYLKSPKEMIQLFPDDIEAISNTEKIAKRCQVELEFGNYHLPEFEVPAGFDKLQYLQYLCEEGLAYRYGDEKHKYMDRLKKEIKVISSMGFIEYFLIVWDFIKFARDNNIMVGPGRGSAAGSLVAYTLGITDVDPIKHGLIFERFLNEERVSMPDIDIDFCIERRGEVIDYVVEKYGADKVSQIITFGTMKARAAIRDVARAMSIPYNEADKIAKLVPQSPGITIEKAMKINGELRREYESSDEVRLLLDTAMAIEGMPRHASTHAAGVVISRKALDEYVPLYMSDKIVATQFNMTTIEELGLLKMDFLGLRNLTVIRDALQMIETNHGKKIDFSKLEYDDHNIYEMISKGNTQGVFQLESIGMTQFMKNLRPSCFEDIVAGISLYRPGPMDSIPTYINNKKDRHAIKYITPELAPILNVTYGCIVYQEQVMEIVRKLAGYSYGQADIVRRAMSKKKADVMRQERNYFIYGKQNEDGQWEIDGCLRRGISLNAAEEIFAQMETFAEYAFNKSHAVAYGVIAYQTAYLKYYYPTEFMAALLSSVMGDSSQINKYITNCREMGITVDKPSVNVGLHRFQANEGRISFGLLCVKNVGAAAIDAIIEARKVHGVPTNIFEFFENLDVSKINKRAMESLIKAGALDCLGHTRSQCMAIYEELMEEQQKRNNGNSAEQFSFFSMNKEVMEVARKAHPLPNIKEYSEDRLLTMEKEMLGVYVSGHPLWRFKDIIEKSVTAYSDEINKGNDESAERTHKDGAKVRIAGIITSKRIFTTQKTNQLMSFANMEDLKGTVELIFFPDAFAQNRATIEKDAIILVEGNVNYKEEASASVIVDKVTLLEELEVDLMGLNEVEKSIKLRIPHDGDEEELLAKLAKVFHLNRGKSVVRIYKKDGSIIGTGKNKGLFYSYGLELTLVDILGKENVKCQDMES